MIFFKELDYITKEEFENKFMGIKIEKLWVNLLKRNIIKYDNENKFCFHYVGVINYNDILIAIIPKYFDERINYKNEFFKIFKLLKFLYSQRKIDRSIFLGCGSDNSNESTKLYNAIMVLEDYIRDGLYKEEVNIKKSNGASEIDWDLTIESYNPLILEEQVIYTEYITNELEFTQDNIITKIQINLLSEVIAFLKNKNFLEFMELDITFDFISYELEEDLEFYIDFLKRKLELQYDDKKIRMINNIINYIEDKQGKVKQQDIYFYGVRRFEYIWEYLCSEVLNNQIKEVAEEFKKKVPKWIINNEEKYNQKNILKPDIISLNEVNGKRCLMILDAKYYTPQYTKNELSKNPGISDITKQYLYQKILEEYIEKNKIELVYNIFIFPTNKETRCDGYIEFDFVNNTDNKILIINININELINLLLERKNFNFNKIYKIIKQGDIN